MSTRCADPDCTARHCVVCRREHTTDAHPQTCPACVGVVRKRLQRIADLHHYGRLRTEAWSHPDDPIPGGTAMVLLGPVSPGDFADYGEVDDNRYGGVPPLLTLATWEDDWRRWSGQPAGPLATIANAVDYLDANLTRMAQQVTPKVDADGDEEWPPDFTEFARDVTAALARLEDVLAEGERAQESKTPCLDCGARLVKRYGTRAADDRWVCPRCRRRYDDDEFVRAQAQQLASSGADRFVRLTDAISASPRPEHTLRTWLRRGLVSAYCDLSTRHVWVWWPDVRTLDREATVRDLRKRSA